MSKKRYKAKNGIGAAIAQVILGVVIAICVTFIVVAIAAAINHMGIIEQAVNWLGGTMPVTEAVEAVEEAVEATPAV